MRTFPLALVTVALLVTLGSCSGSGSGTPEDASTETSRAHGTLPTTIALKAANNSFVSSNIGLEDDRAGILIADRTEAGAWETFELVDQGAGKVAFRASNGKFVTADRNQGGLLIANRDSVGDWETFELLSFDGDRKVLRTTDGMYVTADLALEGERNGRLFANRSEARDWETFILVEVPAIP